MLCRKRKYSTGQKRTCGKGSRPRPQLENLFTRRSNTYGKGKHGARSPQQAIAIGLSKARRAGIPLAPPSPGKTKKSTRDNAERDYRKGQSGAKRTSAKRSRASEQALKKEPHSTASHEALSAHAKKAAKARYFLSRHHFPRWSDIAVGSEVLTHAGIHSRVLRLPGGEPIYVAVVHAKGRGDQNRIVNFKIRGPLLACLPHTS